MARKLKIWLCNFGNKILKDPIKLLFVSIAVLIIPNVSLCFTEHLPFIVSLCNIAWPLFFYWMILSLSKNIGKMIWWLFPIIFLCAFQLVLLHLFGSGIIAVDMFLNVVTTNPGEAFELLNNIAIGVIVVLLLYIPILVWAIYIIRKKISIDIVRMRKNRKNAFLCLIIAITLTVPSLIFIPSFCFKNDIFPVNVCYNLYLALERSYLTSHYSKTSKNFHFDAKSTHHERDREIYVMVVGETARANNFGLLGYSRNTTPLLSKTVGVVAFPDALTESNTTHKSVPMLLSAASAQNYNCIYEQKSIISAFKEAGYKTAFFSNQSRNHSFIDIFGNEADTCVFIKDFKESNVNSNDRDLLKYVKNEIEENNDNLFIVLHTYGSHFKYNERYFAENAVFKPDVNMEASSKNREDLINAYDNTIVQTDRLLYELIQLLEESKAISSLIYTSDHGEDIFDDNKNSFLHSSPIPSYYQLHVPLIVWMSSEYLNNFPQILERVENNRSKPIATNKVFFHTMLDLAGISTPFFNDSLSIASAKYKGCERYFLNDRNFAQRIDKIRLDENDKKLFKKKRMQFP